MRWAGAFSCRWQRLRQWGSPRISPHRARARLSLAKICWPRSPVRRATEMGTQATGWTTLLSRPVRDRPSCAGSTPALPSRISTFGGLALDRSLQASAHPARTEPLRGGRARWGPRAPRAVAESDDVLTRSENDVLEAALGSMDGSRNGRRYNVVITGSTKGVGRALAEKFLDLGDNVVICSRSEATVTKAAEELSAKYGAQRVMATPCDVALAEDVERLALQAQERYGSIDIWINNAGTNGYTYVPMFEQAPDQLREIVATNVLGVMLSCRAAIRVMREQPTGGHIFNMDGAGANGQGTPRFAAYGSTKHAIVQLNRSLAQELKEAKLDHKIQVHNLSPGMVTTELLMSGADNPQYKWFINCLAEPATTVADFLVPRVRQVPARERISTMSAITPEDIRFLTVPGAFQRILSKAMLGKHKNRWVEE